MRDDRRVPFLGKAPKEYDPDFMDMTLRKIEQYLQNIQQPGPIRGATLNLNNLPTSATGLKTGDVWNDTATLKIV